MARQPDRVPTAEEIAEAFEAEANSHFQVATKLDRGGAYRLLVRKALPQGTTIGHLLKDRERLLDVIRETTSARVRQEAELRDAKLRAERDGAERAKSGEWVLAIWRGGAIYESWLDDRWYRAVFYGSDGNTILWDGPNRKKMFAVPITKEEAADTLMDIAYNNSIPF